MISSQSRSELPNSDHLKTICKAISVLDAILSQDWQYRYYSYHAKWGENEACLQMRDGQGDELHILFSGNDACAINGFAHELEQPDKQKITQNLPPVFNEFMFGEPIKSIGTTFCLWTTQRENWQTGSIENGEDHSVELLAIFDGQPQTYINWATDYYEEGFRESGIPLNTVTEIYKGTLLTKKMVLSIVDDIEDWEKLRADLVEIDYPFNFD